ncbi:hypothetical protein [Paenibacillus sp. 23TSA30-6]|uniref:hypothetical protein n=1 Tax=Paenibacillus sp. 23TSA30-6 TaxID=2546104 RepID=UPI001787EAA4|nr:hypothetical protein [Paenibacillus sp. 23TSA30-6]MBE0339341.1 hypothetical protein [Paenibacillus sp. 23TSA30-6]
MKIVYTKYNRNRLPRFQLKTSILTNNSGTNYVQKEALTVDSKAHIKQIHDNYLFMSKQYPHINSAKASLKNDIAITFDFAPGKSLDEHMLDAISKKNITVLLRYIRDYIDYLKTFDITYQENFKSTELFLDIFGFEPDFSDVECMAEANIDLTFDNIFFDGSIFTVIDYEWIFHTSIPLDFIIYRSLSRLFWKYGEYLNSFLKLDDLFEEFQIDEIAQYQKMEMAFQEYVLGKKRSYNIGDQYSKKIETLNKVLDESKKNESQTINQQHLLGEYEDKINSLNSEKNLLSIKLENSKITLNNRNIELDNYKSQEAHLKTESESIKKKFSQLQLKYDTLKKQHNETNLQIDQKITELLNRSLKRRAIFKKTKHLIEENQFLINEKDRVAQQSSEELALKNQELDLLNEQVAIKNIQITELSEQNHEFRLQINHLNLSLHQMTEKFNENNLAYTHLQKHNHEVVLENGRLSDSLKNLQHDYHQLKYEFMELKKQIFNDARRKEEDE